MSYMEIKICTANRITQTTGGNFAKWNNLQNLKNTNSNSYSQTDLVRGYTLSPNRPSTLTLTDFQFNLPAGARVKEIWVFAEYNRKAYSNSTSACMPGQPTITLQGTNLASKKGPSTSFNPGTVRTIWQTDLDGSILNSSDFGIKFDFPRNTNNVRGYVQLRNLYIQVWYYLPEYELSLNKITGESKEDEYEITATISNKTDTTWTPNTKLTIPTGFILQSYNTQGNVSLSGSNVTWTPKLNRISSDTITLYLLADPDFGSSTTYTGTFLLTEDYTQTTKTLNVTVQRYPTVDVETITNDKKAIINSEYTLKLSFTDAEMEAILDDSDEGYVEFNYSDFTGTVNHVKVATSQWSSDNTYTITLTPTVLGIYKLKIGYSGDTTLEAYFQEFEVEVIPTDDDCKNLSYTLLIPTTEELNRLGHGQVYTLQTFLKEITSETRVRDWKYNFRIGVFNEAITSNIQTYTYTDENGDPVDLLVDNTDYETLTSNEIITNSVWSDPLQHVNTYENLSLTFRYNKDYPLYILVTGDCEEATTKASIKFTEPTISETAYYRGVEPNGTYPVPILNTITNEQDELTLPGLSTGNTLVFYDFDTSNSETSKIIRGVELNGNVEGNQIALTAQLLNQGNETRVKSLILQDSNEFSLGKYGDLWGFKTEEMQDFNNWEVHLTPANTTLTSEATILLNNISLTLYLEEYDRSVVRTYIDGEDLSYYGAFLTDLKIPEGLKTNTKYITITGSDTNDPYQQNIEEKTIEIEFELGNNCDIEGNTFAMRQFTKLLTTTRDKYNRPIPKRIEFSHYPDVYWEYILEEGYTPDLDINTYNIKAKLTVPSGVAYNKEETITTNQGYVDGLTHITPVILIKPYNNQINITDLDSKQKFNIGYTNYNGKSIQIDCKNRKVYAIEDSTGNTLDISKYVDQNSDWFRLQGYFNLQTTGCIIQSVTYTEKW